MQNIAKNKQVRQRVEKCKATKSRTIASAAYVSPEGFELLNLILPHLTTNDLN